MQEFFLSDAVRTQDRGEWQFAFGVDSREHIGATDTLTVEYGLTRKLQLDFDLPYGISEEEALESKSRWGTADLGLKYQIIHSSSLALSVGMLVGVPVTVGAETEYQPTILLAKAFRRAQIHASFVTIAEKKEKPSFQYNAASVIRIRHRWFPTLEFNGRSLHARSVFYLTPGVFRRLDAGFQCGIGVPLGVGGIAGRSGIVGKIIWETGRRKPSD